MRKTVQQKQSNRKRYQKVTDKNRLTTQNTGRNKDTHMMTWKTFEQIIMIVMLNLTYPTTHLLIQMHQNKQPQSKSQRTYTSRQCVCVCVCWPILDMQTHFKVSVYVCVCARVHSATALHHSKTRKRGAYRRLQVKFHQVSVTSQVNRTNRRMTEWVSTQRSRLSHTVRKRKRHFHRASSAVWYETVLLFFHAEKNENKVKWDEKNLCSGGRKHSP